MAQTRDKSLEFLRVKVFLYKYTPPFSLTQGANGALFKMDRFSVPLDSSQYYSKYDISNYVASYTFNQAINEDTFNWAITLMNPVITFSDLDALRLAGPKLAAKGDAIHNLAQYDAEGKVVSGVNTGTVVATEGTGGAAPQGTIDLVDTPLIQQAKLDRGIAPDQLVTKTGTGQPTITGLKLSDIIQKYDLVSVFLYKETTPIENLKGLPHTTTQNGFSFRTWNFAATGRSLTNADLQVETILLSPSPFDATRPFFNNEFNGFVMKKTAVKNVGGVDSLVVTGNGITRLFGATRRLLKASALQGSIYDVGELVDPNAATPFQNIYANKTLPQIFNDLFNFVYRIQFDTTANFSSIHSFYDLSQLQVANFFNTNLFTIPPFLLATVMSQRGYSFRQPNSQASVQALIGDVQAQVASTPGKPSTSSQAIDIALAGNSADQTLTEIYSPVFFSQELDSLKPYFLLIEEVLKFFNPELSTPFEIIDEIKAKTFLEFFERNDGTIIIRAPQYNDTTTTIFSTNLNPIESQYTDTAESLIARQSVGYGTDVIKGIEVIKEYAYSNGKLLLQYGFMESGADINPNVKNDKVNQDTLTQTKDNGLFAYAQYFLRIANAALSTGTITADLDPSVQVGKTYYDAVNQRFGYITSLAKTVTIGGTATMNFSLNYVRDAYQDKSGNLQFEQLYRLVDVAQGFSTATISPTLQPLPPLLVL
jgi:hypothetical protein